MRKVMSKGRVLTLAPIFPLEGGLDIYKEFATGVFSWRTAPLIPENRRHDLGVISGDDLDLFFKNEPPGAILTGVEKKTQEEPLLAYAKRNGYKSRLISEKINLWVP